MKCFMRIPVLLGFIVAMSAPSAQAESTTHLSASHYGMPEGSSQRDLRKIARKSRASGLSKVCSSTKPIGALLKNASPGHISSGDPRAPGFALVCSRSDCPRGFPAKAYYSDGTLAFSLGYYGRWEGNGQPRAYCGTGGAGVCSSRSVSSNARAKGRNGKVYIDFGGKSCRSATPGIRNGSPF